MKIILIASILINVALAAYSLPLQKSLRTTTAELTSCNATVDSVARGRITLRYLEE